MTSALDRFTWWPVDHTCSAKANAATSPFWSARWCSLRRGFRVLPDCPTYTLGHSVPRLCIAPWVQGPWDGLVSVWEFFEDRKPLWCLEVGGFFWLSQIDRWCRGGSDWSFGPLQLVWAGYCNVTASGWTSVGSHSASRHPQLSPLPHVPYHSMIAHWLCSSTSSPLEALCAAGWCESKGRFWLLWVGFLYTDVVTDLSDSLHRHTSRKGSFPSSVSFSKVNWMHASMLLRWLWNSRLQGRTVKMSST